MSAPVDVLFPVRLTHGGSHRCPARTVEGNQCGHATVRGKRYCTLHQDAADAVAKPARVERPSWRGVA